MLPETPFTGVHLLNALEDLTDEQLSQPAYFWGENCGGVMKHSDGESISLGSVMVGLHSSRLARNRQQATYQVPGESVVRNILGVKVLEEDYINPSGDSCEPISHYIKGHPNCQCEDEDAETEAEIRATEHIVYPAGTVIIEVY